MDVISDPERIRVFHDQLETQLRTNCRAVKGSSASDRKLGHAPSGGMRTAISGSTSIPWSECLSVGGAPTACPIRVRRSHSWDNGEINFPRTGINSRIAGAFAEDDHANVHLVHSGNVGGGRPGIDRESFLAAYQDQGNNLTSVRWGTEFKDAIVVGRVGDPELPDHVARFIHAVAHYKAETNRTAA